MDLSKQLFRNYFNNKITQEELVERIDFADCDLEKQVKSIFLEGILTEDSEIIENMIYVLLLWKERRFTKEKDSFLDKFVSELNTLLVCRWHEQHENIAMLLQMIKSDSSIDYLYDAISLKPQYLSWDEYLTFEVKCIWAIGVIGTSKAIEKLQILSNDENEIVNFNARRHLERLQK